MIRSSILLFIIDNCCGLKSSSFTGTLSLLAVEMSNELFFSVESLAVSFLLSRANPTDFVVAGSAFFFSSALEAELPNENAGLESAVLGVSCAAAVELEPKEKPGFEAGVTVAAGVVEGAVEPNEKPGFEADAADVAGAVLEAAEPKENDVFEVGAADVADVVLDVPEPKEKAGLEVDVVDGV